MNSITCNSECVRYLYFNKNYNNKLIIFCYNCFPNQLQFGVVLENQKKFRLSHKLYIEKSF